MGKEPRMKPISKIIECPKCKTQACVRVEGRMPRGYDDPNNPISHTKVEDAIIYEIKVSWSGGEQKMIYLASPYSSGIHSVMEHRYELACKACAGLFRQGIVVHSPIVHWHEVAKKYNLLMEA